MLYPTASIILHTRVNRNGLRPVYLRATYKGKSKHFALDMYCAAKDWNESDRRYSKAADGAKESNDLLRSIEQRAADALYQFKRDGATFTFERFEQMVFAPETPILSRLVHEYALARHASLISEGRTGNAVIFKSLSGVLSSFSKTATFADLNASWLAKFERHLRSVRGNTDGGVSVTMRTLRSLCNHASDQDGAPPDWKPFSKYKMKKSVNEGGGRALSMADFRAIESAPVEDGSTERFYLDLFLLSFYLRGANIADMARLTEKNIVAGRIEFVRWKTRNTRPKHYSMPLLPEVAVILERCKRPNSKHLLPILDGVNDLEGMEAKRRIDNATRWANIHIKAVAARVGVDTSNLHFYSARHTGATALGMAGVNPRIIQEYLGHEDFKTTQAYLKKHSPAEVDDAVDVLRRV